MSEADVVYWVLQVRPTGQILPRRYPSRASAQAIRAGAGTDDRVLGLNWDGKVAWDEDAAGGVPPDCCAMARDGKGGPCREQCASCQHWWPVA